MDKRNLSTVMVIRILAAMLVACSCFGQAFTLQDTAFLGVGRFMPPAPPDITTGLIHEWPLNEGVGIIAADSRGNADATLSTTNVNLPLWVSPGIPWTNYPYCLSFANPGGNAFLSFGNNSDWAWWTNTQWSTTLWMMHTQAYTPNDIQGLIHIRRSYDDYSQASLFRLRYTREDSSDKFVLNIDGATWFNEPSFARQWNITELNSHSIVNSNWYWLVITKSNTFYTLYTNAAVVATHTTDVSPSNIVTAPFMMTGCDLWPGALRGWGGMLGDFRIYRGYCLSSTDVSNMYNNLKAP